MIPISGSSGVSIIATGTQQFIPSGQIPIISQVTQPVITVNSPSTINPSVAPTINSQAQSYVPQIPDNSSPSTPSASFIPSVPNPTPSPIPSTSIP